MASLLLLLAIQGRAASAGAAPAPVAAGSLPAARVVQLPDSLLPSCTACHARPHGLARATEPKPGGWSSVCRTCHPRVHHAPQSVYVGRGAVGVTAMPSGMFLARLPCTVCHGEGRAGAQQAGLVPDEADCVACHGVSFRGMLPRWKAEGSRRLAELQRLLASAKRLRGSRASGGAVDSLLAAARANVELVGRGRTVHNVLFADAALRAAARQVVAAFRAGGEPPPARPRLGPDRAGDPCGSCHFGVEGVAVPAFGTAFRHDTHLLAAGLRCDGCHGTAGYFAADGRTRDPAHGRLALRGVEDCRGCHHVGGTVTCSRCHAVAELRDRRFTPRVAVRVSVRSEPSVRALPFVHRLHDVFRCAVCHAAGPDQAAMVYCGDCHGPHHQAKSDCGACHEVPPMAMHPAGLVHTGCSGCHAAERVEDLQPVRAVCLLCHGDRLNHQPEGECAACHRVGFRASAASESGGGR
ncbi:MAG: hypothetical protein HY704_08750 [Gemmatimonadetes bacterium]|nr:hypothetical protein [Gemmatimonadota bacterium]